MLKKAGALPPPEVDAATLQIVRRQIQERTGLRDCRSTFKDGKLFAAPAGQQPLALMAVDKVTFRPTAFDGLVITMNVEAGKVTGFTLKQGATTQIFKRVE